MVAFVCILTLVYGLHAQEQGVSYPDPSRFEQIISAFEQDDGKKRLERNAIICSGSSGVSQWHDRLYDDLAPLTVIPRGLLGSNFNDQIHFAERIFKRHEPRAIILYQGENDILLGANPDQVLGKFRHLVEQVRSELPQVRFYFISIKPSPSQWKFWPKIREANFLIKKYCAEREFLYYIDVASLMLDKEGVPKLDIFDKNGSYLNSKGYEIWRDAVRKVIIEAEWPHE